MLVSLKEHGVETIVTENAWLQASDQSTDQT